MRGTSLSFVAAGRQTRTVTAGKARPRARSADENQICVAPETRGGGSQRVALSTLLANGKRVNEYGRNPL